MDQFGDPFCGILLSLIKQAELPLCWLDPSKTYLCGSNCSLSDTGDLLLESVSVRLYNVHNQSQLPTGSVWSKNTW